MEPGCGELLRGGRVAALVAGEGELLYADEDRVAGPQERLILDARAVDDDAVPAVVVVDDDAVRRDGEGGVLAGDERVAVDDELTRRIASNGERSLVELQGAIVVAKAKRHR